MDVEKYIEAEIEEARNGSLNQKDLEERIAYYAANMEVWDIDYRKTLILTVALLRNQNEKLRRITAHTMDAALILSDTLSVKAPKLKNQYAAGGSS